MPTFTYKNQTITYDVQRSEVSFIKIYLDDLNGIKVTASPQKDQAKIQAFVEKKADWILEKWQQTHENLYVIDSLGLSENQRIPYLGRSYQLILEGSAEVTFALQKGKFRFSYPESWTEQKSADQLRTQAKHWLYKKAHEKYKAWTDFQVEAEEDYTRIGKKEQEVIHLNWRLIHTSKENMQQKIQDLYEEKTS
ncbi:hypothetical protein SAMN05192559_10345 [Halobacillus karajensis]|uniref:YgjP-like metallopeptidase domain-containing protein n=1 Tax=Halobacillus karajensis TaxID=195088 RepID=A0A024P2I1_9BACI|nr:YgjP-like metallopeptidase domain-containing protein [Halobacillus karajensis]CDQ20009.1 hypothetical protein BN982_02317 [Halobacillus karajensis]CDQ22469.1 hypothetical protein BN983_00678 [Halobacillus karajensis]CDQ28312.1 hypothetical protein BN981_02607 [Halobacillus karajensis]SEH68188.1 hypothetical protein SAMN05192559_10345 [Halobacillus karajensis]